MTMSFTVPCTPDAMACLYGVHLCTFAAAKNKNCFSCTLSAGYFLVFCL